jgi:small subunit ribosomal protein S24e
MDIEIIGKNVEPLLKRTSFNAKLVFEGKTPSRIAIKKDLCRKLNSEEGLTIVSRIDTDYGSERATIVGYVYDDDNVMKKVESKHIILRHLTKEERNAEKEKAKAAKQAATPTSGKKK